MAKAEIESNVRRKRPATARRRRDPRTLSAFDAAASWSGLRNADPNRHYVWVSKTSTMLGVGYYRDILGYRVEHWTKDGVSPRLRQDLDQIEGIIERDDYVLMSCPKELHDEIVNYGVAGSGGQQLADRLEQAMTDRAAMRRDLMRGSRGSGVKLEFEDDHDVDPARHRADL